MTCKHLQQESHNFNKHAKFTITGQLTNTCKFKEESFWILKLDTQYPKDFNM